jgi:hypothetical protein
MENKINFKTSGFFSGTITFIGVIFFLVGLVVVSVNVILGLFILLTSVTIFTTHYRLEVDFVEKKYNDYVWILGFRNSEVRKFEKIQYVFIKKVKVSQVMNLRVASSTIHKEQFDAYLKFSETDKLHLMTMDDKTKLIEKLRQIAKKLSIKIVDYSEGQPVELTT